VSFEDPTCIDAHLMVRIGKTCAIAHEAARHGKLTNKGDHRKSIARRQSDKLLAYSEEKRIGHHQECVNVMLDKLCEGWINLAFAADIQNADLPTELVGGGLYNFQLGVRFRKVRVYEHGDHGSVGDQLVEQLQTLCFQRRC